MPDSLTINVGPEDIAGLDVAFKTLDVLVGQLERMQHLREEYFQLISEVVAIVLGLPEQMRQYWDQFRNAGMAGHAEAIHSQRDPFLNRFDTRIGLIKHALRLAQMASVLGDRNIPGSETLLLALQELERLKDSIFGQWQTLEDLEDMLAAQFPLPTEKLEALGRKYQPSSAWYEQEGKPF